MNESSQVHNMDMVWKIVGSYRKKITERKENHKTGWWGNQDRLLSILCCIASILNIRLLVVRKAALINTFQIKNKCFESGVKENFPGAGKQEKRGKTLLHIGLSTINLLDCKVDSSTSIPELTFFWLSQIRVTISLQYLISLLGIYCIKFSLLQNLQY